MLKASIRLLAVLLLFQAGVVGAGGPAHAAAPSNDDVDGAIAFSSLPYSHATNTSEATVGATDSDCGWATVWYAFTASTPGWVELNTVGSDYDTTLALFTGDLPARELLQCNDDHGEYGLQSRIVFEAEAGATYYVSAGTCCATGEPGDVGPGGNLVLNAQVGSAPPAPLASVDVSVASTGFVDSRSGTVTVSGTVTCDVEGSYALYVLVRQRFIRSIAQGEGITGVRTCGPIETPWTVEVWSSTGTLFGGGRATLTGGGSAWNETGSVSMEIPEQRLQLRPRR